MKLAAAAVSAGVLASLVAAPAGGGDGPTLEVPPEVVEHAEDWPLPGRDYANSRARDAIEVVIVCAR